MGYPRGLSLDPSYIAIYVNDLSESIKQKNCSNAVHLDRQKLFGQQCRDCGILTNYVDDSTYTVGSRIRQTNERNIVRALDEIQKYLTDNRLFLNLPKTQITEIIIHQKRGKTNGMAALAPSYDRYCRNQNNIRQTLY